MLRDEFPPPRPPPPLFFFFVCVCVECFLLDDPVFMSLMALDLHIVCACVCLQQYFVIYILVHFQLFWPPENHSLFSYSHIKIYIVSRNFFFIIYDMCTIVVFFAKQQANKQMCELILLLFA